MLELYTKVKWNFSSEATFTTGWLKSLKQAWHWCYKISDGSMWFKPFDCFLASHLDCYACEIKVIDNEVFKFNQLRDNQVTALKRLLKLWRPTIVTIWSKKQKNYIIIPFSELLKLWWDTSIIIDFKLRKYIQK